MCARHVYADSCWLLLSMSHLFPQNEVGTSVSLLLVYKLKYTYLRFLSCYWDKIQEKGGHSGSQFKVYAFHHAGEVKAAGAWRSWSHDTHSQETEPRECAGAQLVFSAYITQDLLPREQSCSQSAWPSHGI